MKNAESDTIDAGLQQLAEEGAPRFSGLLPGRTQWSGEVWITGDVVVPRGGTLEIAAGTLLRVAAAPDWKYRFDRPGERGQRFGGDLKHCALVVLGALRARGTREQPVRFETEGAEWGGVVVLGRGRVHLEHASLSRGGLAAVAGFDRASVELDQCSLSDSFVGALAGGLCESLFRECVFSGNHYGVLAYDFARVRSDAGRLLRNEIGLRADDRAVVESRADSFRGNRNIGLFLHGDATAQVEDGAFEGQANIAVFAEDDAAGRFRNNRLFHNAYGYQARDRARLFLDDEKVGPNDRCGVLAHGRVEIEARRCFFHNHAAEPAFQCQDRTRASLTDCRFFGNATAVSLLGKARARVERVEFQGQRAAALQANGESSVVARGCRFRHNVSAAAFFGDARATLERNEFRGHESKAVDAYGRSRITGRENRFEENNLAVEAHDHASAGFMGDAFVRQREHGILARGAARVELTSCRFAQNGAAAVQGVENASIRIDECELEGNAVGVGFIQNASGEVFRSVFQTHRQEGVSCAGTGEIVLKANTLFQNPVGVAHFEQSRPLVLSNKFWENAAAALCAGASAPEWRGNRLLDNVVGVDCRDAAVPVIVANHFEGSREAAVRCLDRSAPRLDNNRFLRNRVAVGASASATPVLRANKMTDNEWENQVIA